MEGLDLGVATQPSADLRSAVQTLIDRVASVTGHPPFSEHKRMVLARTRWDSDRMRGGDRSVESLEPDDREHSFGITAYRARPRSLLAYAQVAGDRRRREYAVELLVEPEVGRPVDVAGPLLDRVIEQVAALGGGALRLWVPRATPTDDALALGRDFSPERDLIQMRCPLPLPPAPTSLTSRPAIGVATRPFRPGVDEDAWLRVNNRAFAAHPEQGHWDLATLLEREDEEWFDPEGFLVLESDGRMAGWCWTKVHRHATPPMGEIYVIGVDPDFHGRGWGRALTRAGLQWLADQGLVVGMLYVDADNVAAVSLYRSMGFTEDHVDRSYLRTVPRR